MSTTLTRPTTQSSSTHARVAAASLASASLLAIAGFTVLGIVFEYPQILEEPTRDSCRSSVRTRPPSPRGSSSSSSARR